MTDLVEFAKDLTMTGGGLLAFTWCAAMFIKHCMPR